MFTSELPEWGTRICKYCTQRNTSETSSLQDGASTEPQITVPILNPVSSSLEDDGSIHSDSEVKKIIPGYETTIPNDPEGQQVLDAPPSM